MAVRVVSVVKASDELGYGFTVTGERPAVLTAIQQGSAADRAGLTAGDLVLEINGRNVEEATHERIVALVGRTRNAIQLIIVSNAELTRENIAAVAERERAHQLALYRNRFPGAAPAGIGAGAGVVIAPGTGLPRSIAPAETHATASTGAHIGATGADMSGVGLSLGTATAGGIDVAGPHTFDMSGGAGTDTRGSRQPVASSSATTTTSERMEHRERSRSIGHGEPPPGVRRRNSHLEAVMNGGLTSSVPNSAQGTAGGMHPGGESWSPWLPHSVANDLNLLPAGDSPASAARHSIPKSTSDHGGVLRNNSGGTASTRSQDTHSVGSDASQGSQLAGAERHVYPVQVAYFGSVAMKGDLSEQAERLRVTRDCVSECRRQHRRPQTVTMHVSRGGIRLVWTSNGVSETLFISRSAVALTWVDPSDHRVFSLVQRERVYNASMANAGSRASAGSDKTIVQMKGHVFKVLPNVFDTFQPNSPAASPDGASATQSAWPIIRLLKYMYGGKSDRKTSRAASESSFGAILREMNAAEETGHRHLSSTSPGLTRAQTVKGNSLPHDSRDKGDSRSGSLPRSATAAANMARSASPESFTSNTSAGPGGITFGSSNPQFQVSGGLDGDDPNTTLQGLRYGAPSFSSTPQRSPLVQGPPPVDRSNWLAVERRNETGEISHYSPQARRRNSTMNRSGSLDSVYDSSMSSNQTAEISTQGAQRHDRVAHWATNFKSLLADEYGLDMFRRFLESTLCEENLLFWLEVERFKSCTDPDELNTIGKEIFRMFIDSGSRQQVNLESSSYRQLKEHNVDGFQPTSYDPAQKEIFNLMRTDSHGKFTRSDEYKHVLCLELDGKPLPDVAGQTDSNASSEDANGTLRHASTKRKGGFFGFLKKDKDKKDKLGSDDATVSKLPASTRPAHKDSASSVVSAL